MSKDDELQKLRDELERERMRLAGCGVAALGYFDGCHPDYDSASLQDVLRLRARLDAFEKREPLVQQLLAMVDKIDTTTGDESGYAKDAAAELRAFEAR